MLEIDRIYNIDCIDGLKKIDDNSIDCVVTSPPYWGLRDYGTAKWDGGNPECEHKERNARNDSDRNTRNVDGRDIDTQGLVGCKDVIQFRDVCHLCGAKRIDAQIGIEKTPEEYVSKIVSIFKEVHRVLKWRGTVWLNLGDSYAGGGRGWKYCNPDGKQLTNKGTIGVGKSEVPIGLKHKDLVGIPWRVAFALQNDGWWLRQDIIWSKPNPMPESVTDRCTKSHEYVFILSKSKDYYYDAESIKELGVEKPRLKEGNAGESAVDRKQRGYDNCCGTNGTRNKRSVWTITTKPFKGAHFATFPEDLIEPMIKAGCPKDGLILDPFIGSGTTGLVARKLLRHFIGFDLNPEYCKIAEKRLLNIPNRLETFENHSLEG